MSKKNLETSIQEFKDGCFKLYEIKQADESFPTDYLHLITNKPFWFEERSISNSLKFQSESRDVNLTMKIRIPQEKQITSMNVLKIGKEYHKVFNAYHFKNDDGERLTDITLQKYENPVLESEQDG